jgi:uncharacterized protein
MPVHLFPLLFAVAALSGWIDAVTGSGGLLQLPALLLLGGTVPVPTLLGTNKLPATIAKVFAAVTYARRYPVDRAVAIRGGLVAAAGSAAGALLALGVSTAFLRPAILVALVGVAVFILARPGFGTARAASRQPTVNAANHAKRRRIMALALLGAAGLGCYDGMVGPGTGTFLIVLFTTLLSLEFVQVLSTVTWINVGTNLGALLMFAVLGHVLWILGLGMALSSVAGALIGARMTLNRGSKFVRVVLLVVVVCTALRLGAGQLGWMAGLPSCAARSSRCPPGGGPRRSPRCGAAAATNAVNQAPSAPTWDTRGTPSPS